MLTHVIKKYRRVIRFIEQNWTSICYRVCCYTFSGRLFYVRNKNLFFLWIMPLSTTYHHTMFITADDDDDRSLELCYQGFTQSDTSDWLEMPHRYTPPPGKIYRLLYDPTLCEYHSQQSDTEHFRDYFCSNCGTGLQGSMSGMMYNCGNNDINICNNCYYNNNGYLTLKEGGWWMVCRCCVYTELIDAARCHEAHGETNEYNYYNSIRL